MKTNMLKKNLKAGQVCFGTFVRMGSAAVEILGDTGWDFVVIDMEHGIFDYPAVGNLISSANMAGITSIIRVAEPKPSHIMRSLDAGAGGVQIPQVETYDQANAVARAARYHPYGNRGLCSFVRAAGHSVISPEEHMSTSNAEVLTVIHIEGERAINEIDNILEVPGIDVIFLGPWDLSQSLGIPGKTKDIKVIGAMEAVIRACRKKSVCVGTFVREPEEASHWIKQGVQYIMLSTDVGMLAKASAERIKALRSVSVI